MSGASSKFFRFAGLLTNESWLEPAYVGLDVHGVITYLSESPPSSTAAIEAVHGFVVPGFQNAHSHAFQYAMAGLAERHPAGSRDDFWTWREEMYRCALSLNPDQVQDVATQLYVEMLRKGYTHVAEFHYLHHDPEGKPYSNLAEMGERMVAAAAVAGIRITLIPVFYQKGGFGSDPHPRQRRFISRNVDEYLKLLDASANAVVDRPLTSLGMSVHSLRAVEGSDIIQTLKEGPGNLPVHIHVAEQKKEVEECLGHTGYRPMEWILKNLPVSDRFHLVHCTHLSDLELKKLTTSGASAVLCPSTEGNLGDGFFRMKEYAQLGGRWSTGTDSHIGLDPLEEYRMIDYRQRLLTHQRNTFENDSARYMVEESVQSGRRAMGRAALPFFAVGLPFDAVVADAHWPLLAARQEDSRLSTLVFAGNSSVWLGTLVNGQWRIRNGQHDNQTAIRRAFVCAVKKIAAL